MIRVLKQVGARTDRMKKLHQFFCRLEITEAAKENFRSVIAEGEEIKQALVIDSVTREKLEGFLVWCEEVILAAGIEVRREYCEVIEILDDFRYERVLLMKFFDGGLTDEMFT